MKQLKKILRWFFIVLFSSLILLSLALIVTGKSYVFKAILYNFADIDDYKIFDNNLIKASSPLPLPLSASYNKIRVDNPLHSELEKIQSVAFLVVRNDSLLHEEYWDGYSDTSLSNSFSMAKSVCCILTGIALKEGKMHSLDDPVGNYLPEWKEGAKKEITIRHLLTMTSGTDWDESYANPLSMTSEAYYGWDLTALMKKIAASKKPGTEWYYKSGDSQLLGLVLRAATGKSLSAYASEKLWSAIGAEQNALWSTDKKNGVEKSFCCFNSNARDFARIGMLWLHQGNWNGKQIVDSSFVQESILPSLVPDREDHQPVDFYGMQWWILPKQNIFYARGILGQYIIVIPEKNIVIVRLGKSRGEKTGKTFSEVLKMIDWAKEKL